MESVRHAVSQNVAGPLALLDLQATKESVIMIEKKPMISVFILIGLLSGKNKH